MKSSSVIPPIAKMSVMERPLNRDSRISAITSSRSRDSGVAAACSRMAAAVAGSCSSGSSSRQRAFWSGGLKEAFDPLPIQSTAPASAGTPLQISESAAGGQPSTGGGASLSPSRPHLHVQPGIGSSKYSKGERKLSQDPSRTRHFRC